VDSSPHTQALFAGAVAGMYGGAALLKLIDRRQIGVWAKSALHASPNVIGAALIFFDLVAASACLMSSATAIAFEVTLTALLMTLIVNVALVRALGTACPCFGALTVHGKRRLPILLLTLLAGGYLLSVLPVRFEPSVALELTATVSAVAAISALLFARLKLRRVADNQELAQALSGRLDERQLLEFLGLLRKVLQREPGTTIVVLFASVTCEGCLKVARAMTESAAMRSSGYEPIVDIGRLPNAPTRVGNARLVYFDPRWAGLFGARTRPALTVVRGSSFETYTGVESTTACLAKLI
jgi:hypothetical protein